MKRSYKWKFSVALFALLIVELIKRIPAWSAFYGETVYPTVFRILNRFSSRFTFSLYDLLILILIGSLIWIIVDFIRKKKPIEILYRLILFGIWIYVVFYLFWGINYFKPDFYRRTRIEPETYDSLRFDRFVNRYIDTLNANQVHFRDVLSDSIINREIQTGYSRIRDPYRLPELPEYYRPKEMLFGGLYAKMGIKGYYGPFFAETHVNPRNKPYQIAFTRAHETAHLLGITSEAEANFYAFLITTQSDNPQMRFEGYFEILPYVLSNARNNLSEDRYRELIERIDPRVMALYKETRRYWDDMYSTQLGEIQHRFYNFYLRGNNIPQGTANYYQVIGLIMSTQDQRSDSIN